MTLNELIARLQNLANSETGEQTVYVLDSRSGIGDEVSSVFSAEVQRHEDGALCDVDEGTPFIRISIG